MVKKSEDILNKNEKKEIINDVTAAINRAKGMRHDSTLGINRTKKVIFISVFIILLVFSFCIYWFLANNPKTIFTRSVDVTFDMVEQYIKGPLYDTTKGNIKIKVNKADGDYLDLKKYNFYTNYAFDSVNSRFKVKVKTNYNNDSLFDLDVYGFDNKLYLYSLDFFDKFVEFDSINYDLKNMRLLLDSLNTAINKAISDQKVSGSRLFLTVNGKKMYVYKSSLELNKESFNAIIDEIYEIILNDDRFINSYESIFGSSNAINNIEKTFNDIKNKNFNNVVFNVYTKGIGHEFIKMEVTSDNNTFSITNIGKNKYHYLYNLKDINTKYEGKISYKTKGNNTIYNLVIKNNKMGNMSNLDTDITITQKEGRNSIKKINSSVSYSDLSDYEKDVLKSRLNSLPCLNNILK